MWNDEEVRKTVWIDRRIKAKMEVKEVNMNDVKKVEETEGEKEPEREKWSRKIDFLLACVGEYIYCIGGGGGVAHLENIWGGEGKE